MKHPFDLIEQAAVVSFDIFDTLVERVCAVPEHVFALMEPEVARQTGGVLKNFAEVRPIMAIAAKHRRGRTEEECTHEEIYQVLMESCGLPQKQTAELRRLEIETERRVLVRREEGYGLFKAALKAGKRVIVVSDMYLAAETVTGLLTGLGICGWQALYLSSEHRAQKYYGGLWDVVLKAEKIQPSEIVHFGDHEISDILRPSERGVKAWRLKPSGEIFKAHPANIRLYRKGFPDEACPVSIYSAAAQGLTQTRFFSNSDRLPPQDSAFGGDPFQLGYSAVGPAVCGFALWLARRAEADGVGRLFFLSRDGWLPKRVFDILARHIAPKLKTVYLYNSRKSTLPAALESVPDLIGAALTYFKPMSLARFVEDKFGLSFADIPSNLTDEFEVSPETVVSMDLRKRYWPFWLALTPLVIKRSAQMRAALSAYLAEAGFLGGGAKAVVDIGFSGAIPAVLKKLDPAGDLRVYYFFSDNRLARQLREGLRTHSWFEGLIDKFSPQFDHKYVYHYFETLFKRGDEGGLADVVQDAAGAAARLSFKPLTSPKNREILPRIQKGAEVFAADLGRHYGSLMKDWPINPYTASLAYINFWRQPEARDAAILKGLTIDDDFCGTEGEYFLAPGGDSPSYWAEGGECLSGPSGLKA